MLNCSLIITIMPINYKLSFFKKSNTTDSLLRQAIAEYKRRSNSHDRCSPNKIDKLNNDKDTSKKNEKSIYYSDEDEDDNIKGIDTKFNTISLDNLSLINLSMPGPRNVNWIK